MENDANFFDKIVGKIFFKSLSVLLLVIIIFLVSYIFYINKFQGKYRPTIVNSEQKTDNDKNSGQLVCDRTTRLENTTKIDRALSLIYERINEYGTDKRLFPPQLVNCIKVEVKNLINEKDVAGYFDPNNKDIKSNYFPITIDTWQSMDTDDLTTALLLVHELTHVQQFIDSYNLNLDPKILHCETRSSCRHNEAAAFFAQIIFVTKLNGEEQKSINYRIQGDDYLQSQLQTLKLLKDSFNSFTTTNCEKYDTNCIGNMVTLHLNDFIDKSGTYDKQCEVYQDDGNTLYKQLMYKCN